MAVQRWPMSSSKLAEKRLRDSAEGETKVISRPHPSTNDHPFSMPVLFSSVENSVSAGRFSEAFHLVQTLRRQPASREDSVAFELLKAELGLELGRVEDASRRARTLVGNTELPEIV